ncbi:MAG TPA: AAA-associated domain-containing protein [Phycisphaerae bacterium]|nr:AAA-associated domain-containing protein [Phycisphaerae bacterium]
MQDMEDSQERQPTEKHQSGESPVIPVPPTGLLKVLGLLAVLDQHNGKEDIYKLARELRDSFGELLIIIKAAEVLGFVVTPGGDLVMEPLGKEILGLPVNKKKELIGKQIAKLPLFVHFTKFLENRPEKAASRQEIMDELVRILPTERPKPQFDALMNWGRYAEIFSFNRDDDRLVLVSEPQKN